MPAVSVMLPVRNGARYIASAIESIRNQTLTQWELVIIDDNSTDATPRLLEEIAHCDKRIRVLKNPSSGLVSALNTAIAASTSDLLARMDADDLSSPDRLMLQVCEFAKRPDLVALGGQIRRIDEHGYKLGAGQYPVGPNACRRHLRMAAPLCHPAVMLRKGAVQKVGGYREAFRHAEDYDLWLRLIDVGEIDNLTAEIIQYRVHTESVTGRHVTEQASNSALALLASRTRSQGRPELILPQMDGDFELRIAHLPPYEHFFLKLAYWRSLVLNGALHDPVCLETFRKALLELTWAAARTADLSSYAYMMLRATQVAISTRHLLMAAEFLLFSFATAPVSSTRDVLARALR